MTQMTLGVSVSVDQEQDDEEKCEYCDKDRHDFADTWGSNIGNSGKLSRNIVSSSNNHIWYAGFRTIAAHHIICSESMDNEESSKLCRNFGYDINHKNNGVMLPSKMKLACQLCVPLHRGNHSKGEANGLAYPDSVKLKIQPILDSAEGGDYCSNPKGMIEELDEISEDILEKIDSFSWTITADGKDYKSGGHGCSGVNSLTNKPSVACPDNKKHSYKNKNKTIRVATSSLKVGT